MCGHATLASAHIIFSQLNPELEEIVFHTKSGALYVKRSGKRYCMSFPLEAGVEDEAQLSKVTEALGKKLLVLVLSLICTKQCKFCFRC